MAGVCCFPAARVRGPNERALRPSDRRCAADRPSQFAHEPQPEVIEEQAAIAPASAPQTEDVDTGRFPILYVGNPGSEREQDFVAFLGKHFGAIETADLKTFAESQCDGFGVTILDYDGRGFEAPRPRISLEFSRPLITVGVPGAMMCSKWRLKTAYL